MTMAGRDARPPAAGGEASGDLERVRADLRRLGYLTTGLERFFLQDALRRRPPLASLMRLAGREALLGAPVVSALGTLVLGASNGILEDSPLDLPVVWLHLLPPAALATAAVFLLALAALWLIVRAAPRRLEGATLGVATGFVALLAAATTLLAGSALARMGWTARLVFLALAIAGGWVLVRALSSGLLTWAIRVAERAPDHRLFTRRAALGALGLVAAFAVVPLFLLPVAPRPPGEAVMPESPGRSVLVVGLDGVLPSEFDYFLRRGELRELGRRVEDGAVLWRYRRGREAPATFWTTVATGLPVGRHGVVALDGFRPRGAARPLLRLGPARWWFDRVERPLGLAEHRAVLADRRQAWAVWELAARGGRPVASVNWWSTYPAEPLAGLVLAHGAYQLLGEGAAAVVAPASAAAGWAEVRRTLPASPVAGAVSAAVGAGAAPEAIERALRPDQFYREVAERQALEGARTLWLYQPALDLLAAGWPAGEVAFGDVARLELREVDAWLTRVAPRFDAVVLVVDPGRRGGQREGRIMGWGLTAEVCSPARAGADVDSAVEVGPAQVASAVLRALGMPQSRELPDPPAGCSWPEPGARLDSFGARRPPAPRASDEEYLRSLRSLGYL